jgi:hypothetical protein
MVSGDVETGKSLLRKYINGTIGFVKLGRSPKTLMRMFSAKGDRRRRIYLRSSRICRRPKGRCWKWWSGQRDITTSARRGVQMTRSEKASSKFIYFVPIPSSIQAFLLAFAAFLLTIFLGVPLHQLGLMGTIQSFSKDMGVWLVMAAMFLPVFAWFICLAYPPRSWLARLEFEPRCIRFVPKPPLRWIGEPTKVIPIEPSSDELLLCAGSVDSSPYGFRVMVRGSSHHGYELKVQSGACLTARQAKVLSDGAAPATGVPLRLIKRELDDKNVLREVPWTPSQQSGLLPGLGMIALAVSPFVWGIVVAVLRAGLFVAAGTGLAIWLIQSAILFSCGSASRLKSKSPIPLWLSTLVTFSASYTATFALTSYLFAAR